MLEHTYKKIGNQISIAPISYKQNGRQVIVSLNVTNEGLSPIIGSDYGIELTKHSNTTANGKL